MPPPLSLSRRLRRLVVAHFRFDDTTIPESVADDRIKMIADRYPDIVQTLPRPPYYYYHPFRKQRSVLLLHAPPGNKRAFINEPLFPSWWRAFSLPNRAIASKHICHILGRIRRKMLHKHEKVASVNRYADLILQPAHTQPTAHEHERGTK